jgi:hypothetical protein
VKVLLLRSTLAASLLAAVSAPAADQAPAPSPAVIALQSLLRELQKPEERLLPATVRMEKLAARPLSRRRPDSCAPPSAPSACTRWNAGQSCPAASTGA